MKTLAIIFALVLCSSLIYGQDLNTKESIMNSIDSLQNIISKNSSMIDSLKTRNTVIEVKVNKYASALNTLLLEDKVGSVFICQMGTLLYDKPDGINSIMPVKRGDKVKAVEILENHYKVYFSGVYGYVLKSGFKSEAEVIEKNEKELEIEKQKMIREQERIERVKQLEQQRKLSEENRKKELIIKYGHADGTKIFQGYIWIGMTKEMVLESWGEPKDINRSVGSWGVHEQWIYYGDKYVYIENGKLASWQD